NIEGPFEENVVVEEEIAQEGIEIEPSTSTVEPEILPPQPQPQPQQPLFPQQQFVPEPIYYPPVAQPAAPAYYSTSGGYYCFTVEKFNEQTIKELCTFKARLIDGSDKRLDELEVDDWVQTLKGAEDAVDELSREAVFADKVNEGDCLYKVTEYVDTFRKWYSSIFGAHVGVDELPLGIDTLTTMMDYVIPKNLVTM
ncbi:hypothetical protein ANCDUO_18343, partial [Ancylostoma duodenale]